MADVRKMLAVMFVSFLLCGTCQAREAAKKFVPKFSSLGSSLVNMRTGPGMQYPIEWVYKKRDYPVEIVDEYDVWRKIREIDGTEGWMHQGMLSSRRYGIVLEKLELVRTLKDDARIVAYVEPGVVVKLIGCPKGSDRCRVEVKGKHGFIARSGLWGIRPEEFF